MIKYVLVALLASCSPVMAQEVQCAPRDDFTSVLLEEHGEYVVDSGLSRRGLSEMYANEETGTWTFTITAPNGIMCNIAHGEYFMKMDKMVAGDPT